jgi:hypothetical protein
MNISLSNFRKMPCLFQKKKPLGILSNAVKSILNMGKAI